jgi:SHAQKYF class myb-like DNA-binding protein
MNRELENPKDNFNNTLICLEPTVYLEPPNMLNRFQTFKVINLDKKRIEKNYFTKNEKVEIKINPIQAKETNLKEKTEVDLRIQIGKLKNGAWSVDEHNQFLKGIEKFGKGKWKEISSYYVPTRSRIQIASHAQKFFSDQNKK